jgi:hypothetical protein
MIPNIFFTIYVTLSFLLPDIIFGPLMLSKIQATVNIYNVVYLCFFSFSLSLIKTKKIVVSIITFLDVLMFIELNHMFYFGVPISTQNFMNMFYCYDEVFLAGSYALDKLYLMWFVFLGTITLQFFSIKKIKCYQIRFGFSLFWVSITTYIAYSR